MLVSVYLMYIKYILGTSLEYLSLFIYLFIFDESRKAVFPDFVLQTVVAIPFCLVDLP